MVTPHFIDSDLPTIADFVYHEGIHLFYQQPADKSESLQDIFNAENMPTIANNLLGRLLKSRGHLMPGFETDTVKAYELAVAKNDKTIWEKEFKKLYSLPQDCCILPIPNSLPTNLK